MDSMANRLHNDMTKEERDLKRARHAEKKAKLAQAAKSLETPETVVENSTVNSSWHCMGLSLMFLVLFFCPWRGVRGREGDGWVCGGGAPWFGF